MAEEKLDENFKELDENFKELVEENVNLPKKRKRRTKKEIENFYVDPVGMELRIREFYKTGVMCKQLGEDINNIAQRLGYAPNFINYSFKEEMVSDALVQMVNALNRKTFKIGYNPFSYFTKIAYHAFVNTIKKEKKSKQALLMYQEQCHREMENDGIEVRRKREDPISSCLQEKYFSEE